MENIIQKYCNLSKKILELYTNGASESEIDAVYDEMDSVWASATSDEREAIRAELTRQREEEP